MSGITQHHVALLRRHASNLLVASLVLGQHTGAQASCCALPRQWRDTDHASVLRLCEIRENHLITRHSLVLWTKEDQPAPSTVHSLPLARWGELQLHLERCDKVARSSSRGLLDGNPSKFDRVFEIEDDGLRRRVALRYPSRVVAPIFGRIEDGLKGRAVDGRATDHLSACPATASASMALPRHATPASERLSAHKDPNTGQSASCAQDRGLNPSGDTPQKFPSSPTKYCSPLGQVHVPPHTPMVLTLYKTSLTDKCGAGSAGGGIGDGGTCGGSGGIGSCPQVTLRCFAHPSALPLARMHTPLIPPTHASELQLSPLSDTRYCDPSGQVQEPPHEPSPFTPSSISGGWGGGCGGSGGGAGGIGDAGGSGVRGGAVGFGGGTGDRVPQVTLLCLAHPSAPPNSLRHSPLIPPMHLRAGDRT
eukprot:3403130-Prymnesium_polylepis.2